MCHGARAWSVQYTLHVATQKAHSFWPRSLASFRLKGQGAWKGTRVPLFCLMHKCVVCELIGKTICIWGTSAHTRWSQTSSDFSHWVFVWIWIFRIPRTIRSPRNYTPISAMLICPLSKNWLTRKNFTWCFFFKLTGTHLYMWHIKAFWMKRRDEKSNVRVSRPWWAAQTTRREWRWETSTWRTGLCPLLKHMKQRTNDLWQSEHGTFTVTRKRFIHTTSGLTTTRKVSLITFVLNPGKVG